MGLSKSTSGRALLAAALLSFAAGCGTDKPTAEVTGKLTFTDGTPLPAGTRIRFDAQEGGAGGVRSFTATTSEDGSFKTTAEVGKYKLAIIAPEGDSGDFYKKVVHRSYFDDGLLSAEVTKGMSPLDLKVKPMKK
jgi:hypothetical protein